MNMIVRDSKVFLIIPGDDLPELENSIGMAVSNFLEEIRFLCQGQEAILREITLLPELSYRDIVWCKCEWDEEYHGNVYEFYYGDDIPAEYEEALGMIQEWKYDE